MFASALLALTLPLTVFASLTLADSSSLTVHLTSGSFRGASSGAPNNLDSWLGVPYAQPPVGNLRFKAPVPIVSASPGIQNATEFGNACPQTPSGGLGAPQSEDCLFLNVSQLLVAWKLNGFINGTADLAAHWNYC